jgi:tetratricopeptide (TPR) repeat protein
VARAYRHMNAGDLAVERKDLPAAEREYGAAARLLPGSAEVVYWHAVALVSAGQVDRALPLFARAFALDPAWRTLTPRLPAAGLLPDDAALLARIAAAR